jgi:hypothetical protein
LPLIVDYPEYVPFCTLCRFYSSLLRFIYFCHYINRAFPRKSAVWCLLPFCAFCRFVLLAFCAFCRFVRLPSCASAVLCVCCYVYAVLCVCCFVRLPFRDLPFCMRIYYTVWNVKLRWTSVQHKMATFQKTQYYIYPLKRYLVQRNFMP